MLGIVNSHGLNWARLGMRIMRTVRLEETTEDDRNFGQSGGRDNDTAEHGTNLYTYLFMEADRDVAT